LAVLVAASLVVSIAGSASAIIYTHQTGLVGPWSFDETSSAPLVTCNYGPTIDANHYFMTNITVLPPTVYAADRNSAKVDTRHVSWKFQIQRKYYPTGTWKVVASSAVQKATAKDNLAAPFTALTLNHDGHVAGLDTNWTVRIQVLIKWYKPNGSVEGTILFRPSYYTYTTPDFTGVSNQHWCQEVTTSG
jgi:hypothetical protein